MKTKITLFLSVALFLLLSTKTQAQLSIVQTSTNYTIDFDNTVANVNEGTYDGSGFTTSPADGQLNSNAWAANGMLTNLSFGGTETSGDYARGDHTGGVGTGGFYAFTVASGNNAFGVQSTDADWTPGDIILKIKNNTGATVTSLDLSYNILVFNNENRSNTFNFSHSTDNSDYNNVGTLDYASVAAEDASPIWVTVSRNITLSGLSIANGNYYYLKWTGADHPTVPGSGSRDEFALDDIVINAFTGSISAPTVQTEDPANILVTEADFSGNVISSNGAGLTEKGFYYKTSAGVTTGDTKVIASGTSTGAYSANVATFSAETNIFYKAFATNSNGTTLAGNEVSFWTLSTEPSGHPAAFTATANGTTQIDLAFGAASTVSADGYIVLRKQAADPAITGIEDGVAPDELDLPDGTVLATTISSSSTTAYSDINLFGATQYNYLIIGYNWNGSEELTYNYLTSGTPKTANATTVAEVNPPTNHVGSFAAATVNSSSIGLTWTDDAGATISHGTLIMVNTTNSFTAPSDGAIPADDINLTDNVGNIVIARGSQSYAWIGMKPSQQYYFKIYPFTNNGGSIKYKTDGTVPTANATTTALSNSQLYMTEISDASNDGRAKFVELYNGGSSAINFTNDVWYLCRQANASTWKDIKLTGTLAAGETMVVSQRNSDFNSAFGINSDQTNFGISGNGNDGYFLYFGAGNEIGHIYDSYGVEDVDGTGEDWEYTNGKAVRTASVTSPNTTWTASEWDIAMPATVDDMTPGSYKGTFTWAGTVSDVWNLKGNNWYDATHNPRGYVPDASVSVVVPNVATDPVVSSSAVCYSLTISSGGILTIDPNKSLTVGSALTNSNGTAGLIISSDASGTGSLIFGSGTPDAKAQRWVEDDAWHQIGCPTSAWKTSNFYDVSNDSWLMYHTETNDKWAYCLNTDSVLTREQGFDYWVTDARVVEFTGALTAVDQSPSLAYTSSDFGYNLIGNPFSSAIKWDATWTSSNIESSVWIWDNAYNGGDYRTVATAGVGSINDNIIPLGQAFFVRASDASPSITIPISAREHHLQGFYKSTVDVNGKNIPAFVMLKVRKDDRANDIWISFSENATEGFDNGWDATKLFAYEAPGLFIPQGEFELAINTLPLLEDNVGRTVPVSLFPSSDGEYSIRLADSYKMQDVKIVLEDVLTTSLHDLTEQSIYSFNASKDDVPERFLLHFMYSPDGIGEDLEQESNIQIYSYGKEVYIRSSDEAINQNGNVFVYDLMGRKILQQQINSGELVKLNVNINNNYVIVKLVKDGYAKTEKVFIK